MPEFDVTVHIVLDDFGKAGRVYRETNEEDGGLETVIDNLATGQYANPVRVIAFNTAEGWSRDLSEDVAWEVLNCAVKVNRPLAFATRDFVEFHVGSEETLKAETGLI